MKPTTNQEHTPPGGSAQSTSRYIDRIVASAIERERHHQNLVEKHVKYHGEDRDVWVAGLDDHRFIDHCSQLIELHATIADGDKPPCASTRATLHAGGPVLPAIRLTALGRRIVACCEVYASNEHWGVAWANHVFHPAVTVLLRAMKRYALRIAHCHISLGGHSHDLVLGDLLNRLVRFVRRVIRSWRFINAVNAHLARENDNFNSARDFIFYLAGKHTRLCFLRIDLTFRTSAKDFSHTGAADKYVKDFLRSLRSRPCKRNLLPGYLGFLIKRENGISRGTHFHLMIVLNGDLQGNTHYSVDYLTDRLGAMWLQRVGRDRGSFHNCYKDKTRWLFNGLGLQDFKRIEPLAGLRKALHYMTKQDCVLKTSNDKVKNFWRTTSPRSPAKKRGPRRKREDHLSLLYRMLGGPRSEYPIGFDPTPYVLLHRRKRAPNYGAWDTIPDVISNLPEQDDLMTSASARRAPI